MTLNFTFMIPLILAGFFLGICVADEHYLPAIHMKLKSDNASLREIVKARRTLCINEKDVFQKAKQSGSPAWPAMEKSLRKKRPNYNVDATTATEPDWNNVAIDVKDEYFYGEMYAVYKVTEKYRMSKDGRCKVIETKSRKAKLDDGKFRYNVNFSKGRATKYVSEATSRKQTDAMLKQEVGKNPQSFAVLRKTLFNQNTGEINVVVNDNASEKIVNNQSCAYKSINNVDTGLCYWTVMNEYPSTLERPIILKSIVKFGKTINVTQAVSFKLSKSLKRELFSPPSKIKIEDRSR